jgi:chaperonin GroEL
MSLQLVNEKRNYGDYKHDQIRLDLLHERLPPRLHWDGRLEDEHSFSSLLRELSRGSISPVKRILSGTEARKALIDGMKYIHDPVAATLGPQGRNAIIGIGWGQTPRSTRDGVTVAKAIDNPDPVADQGTQMLKKSAMETAEATGDGTTTVTVLAYAMCKAAVEAVEKGANPAQLKNEILKAAEEASMRLGKLAVPVHGERIEQVATIAANNDGDLGRIIAEAIRKAGSHGIITVEDSPNLETSVQTAEGMRLQSGYASPYFVNNIAKQEFQADDCRVFIFERKLGNLTPGLQETLSKLASSGEPLLILAESVEGDMLSVLVANRVGNTQRGIRPLPWCAIRIPQGTSRDALHDIAAVVGGGAITQDRGIAEDAAPIEFLGRAKSVRVTRFHTTIVAESRTAAIEERIDSIRVQLAQTEDRIERDRFQERLAKLSGGVAMIRVGAATEVELKEKKARIEDAIHATKAAIEEGIVPGGGMALYSIGEAFHAANAGVGIVYRSLSEPFRRIVENAGESIPIVMGKISQKRGDVGNDCKTFDEMKVLPSIGWNALTGEYGDLIEMGVVDPLKVTRTALMNAASLAAMVLLTSHLIVDIQDPIAVTQGAV